MSDPGHVSGETPRRAWILIAVLAAAAVPRVLGLRTELWMDEILSLKLVGALESPLGVFTAVHHDNNHYLNSLWIYGVGAEARSWLLRLPPVILGTALVALAYRAVADRGRRTALAAALLVGFSYPLIHYSSEARGYGYVLFLALLGYVCFRRWMRGGGVRWAGAYAVCASLAVVAHLSFVTVFAALLVWSLFEVISVPRMRVRRLAQHAMTHALPAATLGLLFVVDLKDLVVAGGPAVSTLDSWLDAVSLLAGGSSRWLTMPVAAAAAAAILLELRRMFAENDPEALFFASALLLPLAVGVISPNAYARYYLTGLVFGLLLVARCAGRLLSEPGPRRRLGATLVVVLVALNAYETVRFLSVGRGLYREAVATMVSGTPNLLSVAGNHDMGHILTIDHYLGELPDPPAFTYYCSLPMTLGCERPRPAELATENPAEYYVLAGMENRFQPAPTIEVPGLGAYSLKGVFPKYGLSGLAWAVYRAAD